MTVSRLASRRNLLRAAGVSAVLFTGAAWQGSSTGAFRTAQGAAYSPWTDWNPASTGLLTLVEAAILSCNPHNSQPWRFQIGDGFIELFADRTRNIGTLDSVRREMEIGLGCAIETMSIAASLQGLDARVNTLPNPASRDHIARLTFSPAQTPLSPLAAAIARRHTNRAAYNTSTPVPASLLQELTRQASNSPAAIRWLTTPDGKAAFSRATIEATQAIIADRQQMADSDQWFRLRREQIEQHRDGITIDAQGLSFFTAAAAKFVPALANDPSGDYWLNTTRKIHTATASGFGVIAVPDANTTNGRLTAGRLWTRLHLAATIEGLALQPLNQIHERADREQSLSLPPHFLNTQQVLAPSTTLQPVFSFRYGFPTSIAHPSPRRAVSDVIIS